MPTTEALKPSDIETNLKSLNEWKYENNAITRTAKFPGFMRAIEFVNAVAHLAERQDHHPDIEVNYQNVTIRYWTHTANGVTQLDFNGAKEVESMIPIFKATSGKDTSDLSEHGAHCC